jgi:hypothetical protein
MRASTVRLCVWTGLLALSLALWAAIIKATVAAWP